MACDCGALTNLAPPARRWPLNSDDQHGAAPASAQPACVPGRGWSDWTLDPDPNASPQAMRRRTMAWGPCRVECVPRLDRSDQRFSPARAAVDWWGIAALAGIGGLVEWPFDAHAGGRKVSDRPCCTCWKLMSREKARPSSRLPRRAAAFRKPPFPGSGRWAARCTHTQSGRRTFDSPRCSAGIQTSMRRLRIDSPPISAAVHADAFGKPDRSTPRWWCCTKTVFGMESAVCRPSSPHPETKDYRSVISDVGL